MLTNSNITLYNKHFDPLTRKEKYQRTSILAVMWENRKARNVLASGGNIAADQASIYVPKARGANYLRAKAWLALSTEDRPEKWTFQKGDILVRGIVEDELDAVDFTVSSLKSAYDDVLVISSVDFMDMGSTNLHHWKLSAK